MSTDSPTPALGWIVLYVTDVTETARLYAEAFGLEVAFAHPDGDYAEFATGSTALALCSLATASNSTSMPLAERTMPTANVTLVVDDVDAAFARAVDAGATPTVEPVTKPWGQTCSYVADPDGNLIELATRVSG